MTMIEVSSALPHLLKTEGFEAEISRADITRLLKYLDSWREWVYRSWLGEAHGSVTAEELAANVDGLMTMSVVLHCLRSRLPHLPDRLNELLCSNQDGTIADLAERLRLTVPVWIGPVLFSPHDFNSVDPIPRNVWTEDWDEQVALALYQLFNDRPMPIWFFGDFHQLCVARPLAAPNITPRRRSSELRYTRGIHYTPAPVVDFLVAETLKTFQPETHGELPVVLDPSCGTGNLLIASFRYLCHALGLSGRQGEQMALSNLLDARLKVLCSSIYGRDIDTIAIAWARRALVLDACEGCFDAIVDLDDQAGLLDESLKRHVCVADFLQQPSQSQTKPGISNVDFIVGGPPFVRLQQLTKTQPNRIDEYRERYRSARSGQFDLYMLFVEESLKCLRDGGRMGLSIANTFLRSASGCGLRELLGESATVTGLVEFEDSKLYPDAVTQILLLFAENNNIQGDISHIRIKGKSGLRPKLEHAFACGSTKSPFVNTTPLDSDTFRGGDWKLRSTTESDWINALRMAGDPLSKACIAVDNGWSTGADQVFILRRIDHSPGDTLVAVMDRQSKEEYFLESHLLRSIVHGRNISGFSPPKAVNTAIYPFDDKGVLLCEEQLSDEAPRLWDYLLRRRHELKAVKRREKLPWYSPRSPAFDPISGVRLLGAMVTAGRNMTLVKNSQLIAHSSVMRVLPSGELDPMLLLGVMNSSVFWHYTRLTMPTMGMGRHALRISLMRAFPFPPPTRWRSPVAHALSDLAGTLQEGAPVAAADKLWTELDSLAHSFYGIDQCVDT
jgi:Eco57I restriction-modification methylase